MRRYAVILRGVEVGLPYFQGYEVEAETEDEAVRLTYDYALNGRDMADPPFQQDRQVTLQL